MKLVKSIRKSYRALLALAVATPLILIQCLGTAATSAGTGDNPFVPPTLIAQEAKASLDVGQKLTDYAKLLAKFDGASRLSPSDIAQLDRSAQDAKNQLSTLMSSLNSTVQKLKSAGKFTPELDKFAEDQISRSSLDGASKSKLLQAIREHGGCRAVLQDGQSAISQLPKEIDDNLSDIKKVGQPTRVAFSRSTGVAMFGLRQKLLCATMVTVTGIAAVGVFFTGGVEAPVAVAVASATAGVCAR